MSEWDAYPAAGATPAPDPWAAFPPAASPLQGQSAATHLGPLNAPLTAFGNFTDQAVRGATMGLSDKAGALADTAAAYGARGLDYLRGAEQPSPVAQAGKSFSDIYHDALAQQRRYGQAFSEAHPIASPIATGLGIAAAGASPLYKGAFSGRIVPEVLSQGLGNVVARGATIGGMAALGATNDESVAKDLSATAIGMGAGGLTAGALSTAAPYIGKAIDAAASSKLMHKLEMPALITALLEGWHHPYALSGGLAGLATLRGASMIPTSGWQAMLPYTARAAGSVAPGILEYGQVPDNQGR